MKIGIIGGGPAGIFAAIEASKKNHEVFLFDKNEFLGRKLSVTGAGRCNLTNLNISPSRYKSFNNFAFSNIIDKYNFDFIQHYFNNLGIFTYHTDDGWVYPISNSAKNISIYLEKHLQDLGINIYKNTSVQEFDLLNNGFAIKTGNNKNIFIEKLIIASGGKAHPQLNANDGLLKIVEKLGHKTVPAFPALSPIITTKNETKGLSGVRSDLTIRFLKNNHTIGSEFGNIIFTDFGINGPGVMNLSYLVNKHSDIKVEIDFSSLIPPEFLKYCQTNLVTVDNFTGLLLSVLNNKVIEELKKKINSMKILVCDAENLTLLLQNLKFTERILGTRGFEFAQISTGAIDSNEVNPDTLESLIIPGLFFAGEVLDVLGPCGGYNLHWAFVSGIVAARSAS